MNQIKVLVKKNFEMSDTEINLKLTEWLQSVPSRTKCLSK